MIGGFRSAHNGEAGPHFNPIYSATIKGALRAKITRLAIRYQDSLLRLSTDGLLLDRPLPATELGDRPGQLKLEGIGPATILTDFLADRPGKPSRWRKMAEGCPGRDINLTLEIGGYNGLGIFNGVMPQDAWEQMGRFEARRWPVPLGSTVRRNVGQPTIADYLAGPVETEMLHMEEIKDAQRNAAWRVIQEGFADADAQVA